MIANLTWDAEELRHAAHALKLLAMASRNPTVAAWARVEAERMMRLAEDLGALMVLPVAAREQATPMIWPRLEDGADGR